jgi:hypothetical protein
MQKLNDEYLIKLYEMISSSPLPRHTHGNPDSRRILPPAGEKTISYAEARVLDEKGDLVAHGTSTIMTLQ